MRKVVVRLYTFIILIIVSLISVQALASKARMISMSNSRHILDEQQVFNNPIQLIYLDRLVTYESGAVAVSSTTTAVSNAEVFSSFQNKNGSKAALALGHQDPDVVFARRFINNLSGLEYGMAQNPVHLFFANMHEDTSYAMGIHYSNYRNKISREGESTAGVNLAIELGAWQVASHYILINSSETTSSRFDGSGFLNLNAQYSTDTNNFYVIYSSAPARSYTGVLVRESHNLQSLRIGLVESNQRDGSDPFWGAEIYTTSIECKVKAGLTCQRTARSVVLPVWFGFETQAAPWMVLRGSIRQTVLFNQSKDDVGYPGTFFQNGTGAASDFVEGPDSVNIAMGMGLVFGNVTVDGTLQTATTGFFDLSNFLSQVSLKYTF